MTTRLYEFNVPSMLRRVKTIITPIVKVVIYFKEEVKNFLGGTRRVGLDRSPRYNSPPASLEERFRAHERKHKIRSNETKQRQRVGLPSQAFAVYVIRENWKTWSFLVGAFYASIDNTGMVHGAERMWSCSWYQIQHTATVTAPLSTLVIYRWFYDNFIGIWNCEIPWLRQLPISQNWSIVWLGRSHENVDQSSF